MYQAARMREMADYTCPRCVTRCGPLDIALVLKDGEAVKVLCPHCREETPWTEDWVMNYGEQGSDPAPGLERDDQLPHIDPWPRNFRVINAERSEQPAVMSQVILRMATDNPRPQESKQEAEHRLAQSLITKSVNSGEHPIARHKVEPAAATDQKAIRVTIPVVRRPESAG
jgi:hypothetical protein